MKFSCFGNSTEIAFGHLLTLQERLELEQTLLLRGRPLVAEVIDNTTSRGRTLRFLFDGPYEDFKAKITELGETPLPKYIKRDVEPSDEERYQTIFAKEEGAVAAPTAGLHFSRQLLKRLELKGIEFSEITLHVGLGTFRPVEVEDLTKHKMDWSSNYYRASLGNR